MKLPSKIALTIFLFGSVASVALAYTISVTIDSILGVDASGGHVALNNLILPATVYIDGTVIFDHPQGVRDVVLTATVNGELLYGPEKPFADMKKTAIGEYSIPWVIEEFATYEIEVSASAPGEGGENTYKKGCPAAPSIATHYLRDIGERVRGDIIHVVAKRTGKQGSLWAKNSCDPDYTTQTISIVVGELEGER